jgi:hypothetical protein
LKKRLGTGFQTLRTKTKESVVVVVGNPTEHRNRDIYHDDSDSTEDIFCESLNLKSTSGVGKRIVSSAEQNVMVLPRRILVPTG